LLLAAASTHPFAHWTEQEIYPDERYKRVVEDLQLVARANLVFGLHITSASRIATQRSTS